MNITLEQYSHAFSAAFRKIGILLVALYSLVNSPPMQAAYHNPTLKVLLFKSSVGIYLNSPQEMTLGSGTELTGTGRKILITPDGPDTVRVNNTLRGGNTLIIRTIGKTQVLNLDNNKRRSYLGDFEIRLLNNSIHIINHIPTEQYLEGVLNAEISTRWHMEVVKAQAVISRTFALFKRKQRTREIWHLSADHHDQVYKGTGIADQRGRAAIRATRGIVVGYRGQIAQTFYHSNCGGMTADPGNTWQHYLPYLKIKPVPFGKNDPRYHWSTVITDQEMRRILMRTGLPDAWVNKITISKRTSSNRVFELTIHGQHPFRLSGMTFRKASGYKKIQSLLFNMKRVSGGYRFEGTGNGHGVGLSQWSAKEMAEKGYRYNEIISYFYQDTELLHHKG